MSQMLHNPAKTAYMRFDAIAKTMKRVPNAPKEKGSGVKGLLKRMKQISKDDDKEQEPLEIAIDYFIAIRQQREKLKQEDK
tara:strand:+ start:954 stop:1196 length:243 start_codon:yes stop_codon:yes gene_type:complete